MGAAGRLWPNAAELSMLRFVLPVPSLADRLLLAAALFTFGLAAWGLAPWPWAVLGLPLLVAGHLPLWVRTQSNAPGGATPQHEEIWVPVEDEWLERVDKLERKGRRWDATPWDLTNARGCLMLLAVLAGIAVVCVVAAAGLGPDGFLRLAVAAPLLLVPLWLNGVRSTWNPSELHKKGEALAVAREVAEASAKGDAADDFDLVPLLALREGKQGKYPVDARLMLRPKVEDGSGFLGVQVQVAMNNVQGTDYPYLYCVVLGKKGFRIPQHAGGHDPWPGWKVRMVYERGKGDDVVYLVIRQHADRSGGWHTEPEHVREIVARAIEEGRKAWRENRTEAGS
jgi:hypothetical protein